MAKFLYSFNWNIDTRTKLEYTSRKTETFTPVQTEFGTITAVDNPYNSYMKGTIAMFRITLNNESIGKLLNGIELRTCSVEEINMYTGLCGMLTIEIFGSTGDTTSKGTFREMYNISYTLLGTLVLTNFCTQLTVDLIFSFFTKYFNIKS